MTDVALQNVQNIFFGNHQVDKVFLGDRQVRPEGTPPTPVVPTNGLLGYRKLESDLLDTSGNGYNASWYDNSGMKNFVTVGGKTGAYVYRRSNSDFSAQHIVTPLNNVGIAGIDKMSLCGWVWFNDYRLAGYSRPGPATNVTYDPTTMMQSDYVSLSVRPSSGYNFAVGFRDIDGGGDVFNSNVVPTELSWYFVCFTFFGDEARLRIYIDGRLDHEIYTGYTYINKAGDVWRFGCSHTGGYRDDYGGMDGYIRDWAVYDRELSPQEVSDFYNATL